MDQEEKSKLSKIIKSEIQLEDSMLELYSTMIKNDNFLDILSENDRSLVQGIIDSLLRDTAQHKNSMQEIIENL